MQFCSLGSGSRGNAWLIEHRGTTLLLDCGFTLPDLRRRLARRATAEGEIDAVLVTHEHKDHVSGLRRFLEATNIPAYMTRGTALALDKPRGWRRIEGGGEFVVGEMQVLPFDVSHDAAEPVQFVIDDGARRAGFATDLGVAPAHLIDEVLRDLSAIVVECNYDARMLAANRNYPRRVKERISGDYGHLDNAAAAELIAAVHHEGLRHIVAAHLSEQNNTAAAAMSALQKALGGASKKITIATQQDGTDWLVL